jgi:hypothetical protein
MTEDYIKILQYIAFIMIIFFAMIKVIVKYISNHRLALVMIDKELILVQSDKKNDLLKLESKDKGD